MAINLAGAGIETTLRKAPAPVESQYRKSSITMIDPELEARKRWWEGHSDQFFVSMQEQEDQLIAAGHDAKGMIDWAREWLIVWNDLDVEGIGRCITPDCVWEDPSMFGDYATGRHEVQAWSDLFFQAIPDLQFYPRDGESMMQFVNGRAAVCVPWQAIGTWTAPMRFWFRKEGGPALAPTGTKFEFTGVDRYILERVDGAPGNFQIKVGKTNYDILNVMVNAGMMPPLTSRIATPLHGGFSLLARGKRLQKRLRIG